MRKFLAITAALGLLSGCAWFGSSDESQATTPPAAPEPAAQPEPAPAPEPEPAPAGKTAAKSSKKAAKSTSAKSGKSEAQIQAELDQMGKKLVAQSARTLMPNESHKEVRQAGGQWVATYNKVDTNSVNTEMKPGAKPGLYVGIIRYVENIFECRGSSRQAALAAPCEQTRSRRMTELISYDGKQWND